MTGAMYAAIAGLRTHMQNLNVIGNNVANVNTYGYKASRSVFRTSIYTTLSGGSDGTNTVGGKNPSQIGYGANLGSVDIDMSTGNYAVTGKATDMMIDGDGFFMVGDKTIADTFDGTADDVNAFTALNLTRVGNFEFKADGYLTNNDGQVVYGFLCTGIDAATGKAVFSDQLVPIRFPGVGAKDGANGELELKWPTTAVEGDANAVGKLHDAMMAADPDAGTAAEPWPKAKFNGITVDGKTGVISGTCAETGEQVVIGAVAIGMVTNPNGVTSMGNSYYKAGEGAGNLSVALFGGAGEDLGITYVNGELAQAPADGGDAPDPVDGLRLRKGAKNASIISGGLEMSKTDLAQEISQMILTQRGYQANTRIITVTDSMLEELVNMKR
jgi:flagellar hook protein FlgE